MDEDYFVSHYPWWEPLLKTVLKKRPGGGDTFGCTAPTCGFGV